MFPMRERRLHSLDVRRVLAFYLQRVKPIRKMPRFFVTIVEWSLGQALSVQRLCKWISGCIISYQLAHLPSPEGVRAHSTRGQVTSINSLQVVLILDICKAATWSSIHTFTKHYTLFHVSSADAAAGTAVLQTPLSTESSHPFPMWVLLTRCGIYIGTST